MTGYRTWTRCGGANTRIIPFPRVYLSPPPPPCAQVRSIWLHVYLNYAHEFDYFMIGGDDMYVIVQNLRRYTATRSAVCTTVIVGMASVMGGRMRHDVTCCRIAAHQVLE